METPTPPVTPIVKPPHVIRCGDAILDALKATGSRLDPKPIRRPSHEI